MEQGETRKIREIRGWNEWTEMYADRFRLGCLGDHGYKK